jgi:glucose-1-phosphate thymidylyltransferase
MRAIIPVAGVGSRLRPHTYTLPKVLLNVAGKPIIGHILDKVIDEGFDEATIVVGYLGDKIREYILSNYTMKVDFIEQEERKGLAHSIYLSREKLSTEPVLIILGDTIFDVELKAVVNGKFTSVGVKHVDDPRRFGVAETKDGFVTHLVEKPEHPTSNLAIVGLYWIRNPQLLNECVSELITKDIKTKGEYQLTDALELMVKRGERIGTFTVDGWYDCGKPDTLLATNRHLL